MFYQYWRYICSSIMKHSILPHCTEAEKAFSTTHKDYVEKSAIPWLNYSPNVPESLDSCAFHHCPRERKHMSATSIKLWASAKVWTVVFNMK